jgi:4a-hydroxytetrahydrobiopterin dehydratase
MKNKDLISEAELGPALRELPGWKREDKAISRQFTCKGFGGAMALVVRAGLLAERADHHPDILVQFNKVTFTLTSHDVGGISARDLVLARALDEAAAA